MLRYDSTAWREGYMAGLKGDSSNPYPDGASGDTRSLSWASGRIEGRAEREAAERDGRPVRLPQSRPIRE